MEYVLYPFEKKNTTHPRLNKSFSRHYYKLANIKFQYYYPVMLMGAYINPKNNVNNIIQIGSNSFPIVMGSFSNRILKIFSKIFKSFKSNHFVIKNIVFVTLRCIILLGVSL